MKKTQEKAARGKCRSRKSREEDEYYEKKLSDMLNPEGYRKDSEMLKDLFELIGMLDDPKSKVSRGGEMVPFGEVALLEYHKQLSHIGVRIKKARPEGGDSYLLKQFIKNGLGSDECLFVAALCYAKAVLGDRINLSWAIRIVAGKDRLKAIKFNKCLQPRGRLVTSKLIRFRRPGPFCPGEDLVDLGDEVSKMVLNNPFLQREEPLEPGEGPQKTDGKVQIVSPRDVYDRISQYVIGQEKAKQVLSVAVYNHFLRVTGKYRGKKSNVLMAGPTGCGKTYLAEVIARMLDVPIFIADANQYTETGYIGRSVEEMFVALFQAAGCDPKRASQGIIFIDEIDKIAATRDNFKHNSTNRDISGEAVQQELLKAIEGADFPDRPFSGENVLFIGGGAFSGLEALGREGVRRPIGFGKGQGEGAAGGGNPTQEDFVKFGMIPELMGRFQTRVFLSHLDDFCLRKILTEPKDSVWGEYRELFASNGIELKAEEAALDLIAHKAARLGIGARGLRSVLEEALGPLMFESFAKQDCSRNLVVTPGLVEKGCSGGVRDCGKDGGDGEDPKGGCSDSHPVVSRVMLAR